jgi:SAM-dependent methyltransferase
MPAPVADHYANLLAPIYAWMVGDFEAACASNAAFFDELALQPSTTGVAVDLGCGHGVQAVPLARRGFSVVAIDSSALLLEELRRRAAGLPVTAVHDDLLHMARHLNGPVDVVTCMGDTLTHLESPADVRRLLEVAAECLAPSGLLVLSFRDYATRELTGTDRFIPVRADDTRIHTCFLEYRADVVNVHDIVHSRSGNGWQTAVSAYLKLRLAPGAVLDHAAAVGLSVRHQSVRRGMLHLAFARRA